MLTTPKLSEASGASKAIYQMAKVHCYLGKMGWSMESHWTEREKVSDFFTQFTEIQMGKIVHIFKRFSQTFFVLTKVSTVEYNQPSTRFVSTSMAMNFSCSSTQACQSKLQLIFLYNMATKFYIQFYTLRYFRVCMIVIKNLGIWEEKT